MTTRTQKLPEYTHMLLECYRCSSRRLNSEVTVLKAIRQASALCRLTVLQEGSHRFHPKGVTGYALLRESHISVHTWPEHQLAVVDVLSCAEFDPQTLMRCFQQSFKTEDISILTHSRRIIHAGSQHADAEE